MIKRLNMSRISQAVSQVSCLKVKPAAQECTRDSHCDRRVSILGRQLQPRRVEVLSIMVYYGDVKTGRLVSLERQIVGRFHPLKMSGEKGHEILRPIGVKKTGVQNPQITLLGCASPDNPFGCVRAC